MIPSITKKHALAVLGALSIALHPGFAAAQPSPAKAVAAAGAPAPEAAPAPAEQLASGRYSESGSLRLGGSLGADIFSSTAGFRIQVDGQYALYEVAPWLYLDLAAQMAGVFASGMTILELVPKARLRYVALDPLILYGDAGLGFAFSSLAAAGGSDAHLWGDLRFAGGVQYRLTPELDLVVEPVGLNVYFGTGSAFHYSILAGILYRFP